MNKLLIGNADKIEPLLKLSRPGFLLIDDGPIADAFLERFPRAKLFDPTIHSFNPLRGIDYPRARAFASALYTASPEGQNTLTVRNGKRTLTKLLLDKPERLDRIKSNATDPGTLEALATIEDLLLSPLLKRVLCNPTNVSFKGSVVAKIDRAELGDFDAFVLGSLLIAQFGGQIILPDFGFYGRDVHMSLIRQNRLTAGIGSLAEVSSQLSQGLLSIKDKTGEQCTWEDATLLARYARLDPNTNRHTEFVQRLVG